MNVEVIKIENIGCAIVLASQKIDAGSKAQFAIDTPISKVLYLLDTCKI